MSVTVANYKADRYYPRIVAAVSWILARSDVVTPAEVLVEMGNLSRDHYEAWRPGRIPYLEKVITMNLSKVNRVLRILRMHAHDLDMKPSMTVYCGWKGGKWKKRLRFSKTGENALEEAYSRHFLWNKSQEKKPPVPSQE